MAGLGDESSEDGDEVLILNERIDSLVLDDVVEIRISALTAACGSSSASRSDLEVRDHLRELGDLVGELNLSVTS